MLSAHLRPGRVLLVGGSVIFAVAAGAGLGTLVGRYRAKTIHGQQERVFVENQRRQLMSSIRGIRIGEPFPSLSLWSVDGKKLYELDSMLPRGGIVLMVSPGCADCLQPLFGLREAQTSGNRHNTAVLVVADQARFADSLEATMHRYGLSFPLYVDQQEWLRRQYHVVTTPTYFRLDSNGVVVDLGAGRREAGTLADLLSD